MKVLSDIQIIRPCVEINIEKLLQDCCNVQMEMVLDGFADSVTIEGVQSFCGLGRLIDGL